MCAFANLADIRTASGRPLAIVCLGGSAYCKRRKCLQNADNSRLFAGIPGVIECSALIMLIFSYFGKFRSSLLHFGRLILVIG